MDKKKFDKIMDEWAAHEMKAAPDLKPSPKVYQKLEEKKKKPRFVLFSWPVRLAAAGIAAALIIVVIVLQPPKEVGPFVGLRKGAVTEKAGKVVSTDKMQILDEAEAEEQAEEPSKIERTKGIERVEEGKKEERKEKIELAEQALQAKDVERVEKPKEADKEAFVQSREAAARPRMEMKPEKKDVKSKAKKSQIAAVAPAAPATIVAGRIEFQYQPHGSESIEGLDIQHSQDEILTLSSMDNYRLILQLPQERYVYVFQVGADKQLIRLFPNSEYSPTQNPLQAGKTVIIPLPPNWFYVGKDGGEVQVYMVDSAEPLQDWDEIYALYSQTEKRAKRKQIATGLLDQIEQDKKKLEEEVSVRVFKFNVRGSH
jgi:cytoskeletal protein RodZ